MSDPDKCYVGHEFEALRCHLDNYVQHIRWLTQLDLKLFFGFFTAQLALASFISSFPVAGAMTKIGLLIIDVALAVVTSKLLYNSHKRRKEVVGILHNLNFALGFETPGAYLVKRKINVSTTFRPWLSWYLTAIVAVIVGVAMVLFTA